MREDLRSRRNSLGALLARHGLALDDAVLDDPERHLVRRKPAHRGQLAHPLKRLDEVLDDLELALAEMPVPQA